jgi:hypothetical protein
MPVDWVRRYRAILEVLRTEPLPDAMDVTPILLWIESGGGRAADGHRAAMHEAAGPSKVGAGYRQKPLHHRKLITADRTGAAPNLPLRRGSRSNRPRGASGRARR